MMEGLLREQALAGSYDPFTCSLHKQPFFECLDIGSARTLGGTINSSVNLYTEESLAQDDIIELESSIGNISDIKYFGAGESLTCSNKTIGDGVINVFDIAILMWYQFKSQPYDRLPNDPSNLLTVEGRDETQLRCNMNETRDQYHLALGKSYCTLGPHAEPFRMLSEAPFLHTVQTIVPTVQEISSLDTMLDLKVEVLVWAELPMGTWYRISCKGIQTVVELFLHGVATEKGVPLSMVRSPSPQCNNETDNCMPYIDNAMEVRFQRRFEQHADSKNLTRKCATIVSGAQPMVTMIGNTIAVRQQPPRYACAFDLFIYVPDVPQPGQFSISNAPDQSYAATRLAELGADRFERRRQPEHKYSSICVLAGSSAMSVFGGHMQTQAACAKKMQGPTPPTWPAPTPPLWPGPASPIGLGPASPRRPTSPRRPGPAPPPRRPALVPTPKLPVAIMDTINEQLPSPSPLNVLVISVVVAIVMLCCCFSVIFFCCLVRGKVRLRVASKHCGSEGSASIQRFTKGRADSSRKMETHLVSMKAKTLICGDVLPRIIPMHSLSSTEIVEVRQEDEHVLGARYKAQVLETANECMRVQYLLQLQSSDFHSDERLTEWLCPHDIDHVRPEPPEPPDWFYIFLQAGDLVELQFADGWWPVTVSDVPVAGVSFEVKSSKPEIFPGLSCTVTAPSLRPAWQWQGPDRDVCWKFLLKNGSAPCNLLHPSTPLVLFT